jgi:abortive infection bacteriophage resistance protein
VKYNKPATTCEQQADLVLQRGMVADRGLLIERLRSTGYYRLCAYWYPFKQADETFAAGTTFDTVWERYAFDRQLRLAVMDAIERIEVAVRASLVTELAIKAGPFAHLDRSNFPLATAARHTKFVDGLQEEAHRSKEVFVEHFKNTYDEFPDLPIWAAAEIMTFGTMLTAFNMSSRQVQKAVAHRFGLNAPVLASWLLTLNYIRNLCAHHSRLWNRELALKPLIPDEKHDARWYGTTPVTNDRMFVVLTLLHYSIRRVAPQTGWRDRLFALFDRFPNVPIARMGIPNGWRTHDLWTN